MKKTALIFPGQGSQYLGMGKAFIEGDSAALDIFTQAESISSFPVQQLCFDGPLEDLTRVLHLQPCLTAVNLVCLQQLQKALPGFTPSFLAGHSLGEYSALCAAGVLSVENTLKLVTKRGELMEREGVKNPGGMRAVLGLEIEEIDALISSYQGEGIVVVANHNTSKQVVLSGNTQGLDEVGELCSENGAKVIPLKVSVANHSPLVAGAVEDFTAFMDTISFEAPQVPVYFNVTGDEITDPAIIKATMGKQIASRVRWVDSISRMVDEGVEVIVELGPKNVLTGMMKKILPRKSGITCLQADTPEAMVKVVAAITS